MLAGEFVGLVFTKFKGKVKTKAPKTGDAKFGMYLDIANEKVRSYVDDIRITPRKVRRLINAPISAPEIVLPSDYARLADAEIYAGDTKLEFLNFDERNSGIDGIYELDGKFVLTKPDSHIGKSFKAGIIFYPPLLVNSASEVICDSTDWLVLATAASIAFNDPQKQDNYPDLFGLAGNEYQKMTKALRKKPRGSISKAKYGSKPRLGRTW